MASLVFVRYIARPHFKFPDPGSGPSTQLLTSPERDMWMVTWDLFPSWDHFGEWSEVKPHSMLDLNVGHLAYLRNVILELESYSALK